jgi:hypothetical protein
MKVESHVFSDIMSRVIKNKATIELIPLFLCDIAQIKLVKFAPGG